MFALTPCLLLPFCYTEIKQSNILYNKPSLIQNSLHINNQTNTQHGLLLHYSSRNKVSLTQGYYFTIEITGLLCSHFLWVPFLSSVMGFVVVCIIPSHSKPVHCMHLIF